MDSSHCISRSGLNYTRKGGKWSFNVGKGLVEYSIIIPTKSKTGWGGRHFSFIPAPKATQPIIGFRYFTEQPLNGNRSSLFCKYGNRLSKLALLLCKAENLEEVSSFTVPLSDHLVSHSCVVSLKSTHWRIVFLEFAPRTLLTLMQTSSCD